MSKNIKKSKSTKKPKKSPTRPNTSERAQQLMNDYGPLCEQWKDWVRGGLVLLLLDLKNPVARSLHEELGYEAIPGVRSNDDAAVMLVPREMARTLVGEAAPEGPLPFAILA